MRFGPTSLRLSGALAKGLRRPKLRTDLRVSEQTIAGQTTYMIKVPETESFVRFGSYEYELLKLCDGTRTAAEVAVSIAESHPDAPVDEAEVSEWVDAIDPSLWERSLGEKNLAILEKIREERKNRLDTSSLFYMRFAAWDPNRVLERLYPYLRWFYSRAFILCSLLLFAGTTAIVVSNYVRIRQDTVAFYSFANKTAYDLWVFWFLLFVVSGIHEFGHGLTCKHFGGDVHQMGLLLIYFTPAFFTDCSEMYMFDRTSKRLWTIFAGIWIELVTCGIATWIWYLSPPGSLTGDLGYKTLLLTGVSGVFFNLNPLMKFDGYFALSQYLEIDNLYEDAFVYLKDWLRRYVFRQDVELPAVSRRRRWIFLLYALGAFGYSTMVLFIVTVFVKNVFTSRFGAWGYLMTVGVVYLLLRKRVRRWLPAMRAGLREAKEKVMAWRVKGWHWAGVAAVAGLLILPSPALKISTDFVLEPGERAEVRACVPGFITDIKVREGDFLEAGEVLAVLRNPDLEAQLAVLEHRVTLAERSLLADRAGSDLKAIQKDTQNWLRLEAETTEARARCAELILRAPIAGVATSRQLEQRVGEYLDEGGLLTEVANRRTMRARILVLDRELEDVTEGGRVKLNLRAVPFHTFYGRVQKILPAAAPDRPVAELTKPERAGQILTNYFAVVLEFPNQNDILREGMTGLAKIYTNHRHPLAWQAARSAWRWLHSQIW
jgi:putative peptide zinc metalloprotease protein